MWAQEWARNGLGKVTASIIDTVLYSRSRLRNEGQLTLQQPDSLVAASNLQEQWHIYTYSTVELT
jgi:hypothetical protein